MTKPAAATRSLVIEREMPYPAEKIRRAPHSRTADRVRASGPRKRPNYQGASYGWQRYIAGLKRVAAGLD
jgi:hypothetical protein